MALHSMEARTDAFARLRAAWASGRPIVPLFGAGISVCAGIPFGPHIVEYLLGMKLLSALAGWHDHGADYIVTRGWPDPHRLRAELAARFGPRLKLELAKARTQVARETMLDALSGVHPAMRKVVQRVPAWADFPDPDWWSLIHQLTGGRESLIEAFFDGMVRDRRPGNAHQFIAYLARLANWKLILTTNFDDLIETALRDDGLRPVVYELVRGGTLPDQNLVARHLSVIKLHGGSFGLRTGFDLHETLDAQSIAMFATYVPLDALVLVVGQGGNEQRVVSLVHSLLDTPQGNQRQVLWIHYEEEPRALSLRFQAKIHKAKYGDASLFFHELYQRLAFYHPVGREAYQALHHLPEGLPRVAPQAAGSAAARPARAARRRPSRSDMCERYERAKTWPVVRLWFNVYQFTSVAAFMSALLEHIQHGDQTLPPLFLSPVLAFTDLERAGALADGEGTGEVPQRSREIYRRHIAFALRRQRYLIAIDALNGFANPQSTLNVRRKLEESQGIARSLREELYVFLQSLAQLDLGESEIWVSTDPHDGRSALDGDGDGSHGQRRVTFVEPERSTEPNPQLLSESTPEGQLLRLAISFRKPRPLAALVTLADKREKSPPEAPPPAAPLRRGGAEKDARHLDAQDTIEMLVSRGLLERQDGGLYSMDGVQRDQLFTRFLAEEPDTALGLQYEIAMYYRNDLYQQSRDIGGYLEYVFHRLACIDHQPNPADRAATADLEHGWQKLFGSLERERRYVLGRGQAASLLDVLCSARWRLLRPPLEEEVSKREHPPSEPERAQFASKLRHMCLEIRRSISDIDHCLTEHIRAAQAALEQLPELAPAARAEHAATAAWQDQLKALRGRLGFKAESGWHSEVLASLASALPPARVLDLVDSVLSIAEDAGRLMVVHQDSPVPRQLTEWAQRLLEQLSPASSAEEVRRRALLEVRCHEGLMDISLRGANPWSLRDDPVELQRRDNMRRHVERAFLTARNLLVEFGQPEDGMAERFSTLRCLLARAQYLSGRFGQASEELNRAQSYAERATDARGAPMLAVFYLYRAECCILFSRSQRSEAAKLRDRPAHAALLEEALTALRQAETEFGGGRRDVFWMVRLFILRARAHLEQLRLELLHGAEQASGAARQRSTGAAPRADLRGDPAQELALSQLAAEVLTAIYGAWINNHENAQRDALIDEIWDELEELLKQGWAEGAPGAEDFRTYWLWLNAAVGLDDYREQREQRYEFAEPVELAIREDRKQALRVINMSSRGILFHARPGWQLDNAPIQVLLIDLVERAGVLKMAAPMQLLCWHGTLRACDRGLVLQAGLRDIPCRIALKALLSQRGKRIHRQRGALP